MFTMAVSGLARIVRVCRFAPSGLGGSSPCASFECGSGLKGDACALVARKASRDDPDEDVDAGGDVVDAGVENEIRGCLSSTTRTEGSEPPGVRASADGASVSAARKTTKSGYRMAPQAWTTGRRSQGGEVASRSEAAREHGQRGRQRVHGKDALWAESGE